eukprot:3330929-Prymnesium_polylepis.1
MAFFLPRRNSIKNFKTREKSQNMRAVGIIRLRPLLRFPNGGLPFPKRPGLGLFPRPILGDHL